jgi:hypothetical protein
MPIEDITFLQTHGVKEDHLLFVDSSRRDKVANPRPHEYVVTFNEPYTNVCGIDVIDAAVPRTMYNIDVYNNTLVYGVGRRPAALDRTLVMEERDYTIDTLIASLNQSLNNLGSNRISIKVTIVADGAARVRFTAPVPFVFDMEASSLNETLGCNELLFDNQTYKGFWKYTHPLRPNNLKLYASRATIVNRMFAIAAAPSSTSTERFVELEAIGPAGKVRQPLRLTAFTTGTAFEEVVVNRVSARIEVQNSASSMSAGSRETLRPNRLAWALYDSALPDATPVASGMMDVPPPGVADDPFGRRRTVATMPVPMAEPDELNMELTWIDPTRPHWLDVWRPEVPPDQVLGQVWLVLSSNEELASEDVAEVVPISGQDPSSPAAYACVTLELLHKTFFLEPEGLVMIAGDRFVLLRCPEVEQHLYGSAAYGNNVPGLALFKLGVLGFADSRFDFSSVAPREFHPIGKLPKLTLRFERLAGQTYNFRGVNHHIVMVIRTWQARAGRGKIPWVPGTSMNPLYEPDISRYPRTLEEREASSEEDEDYDRTEVENTKDEEAEDGYVATDVRSVERGIVAAMAGTQNYRGRIFVKRSQTNE